MDEHKFAEIPSESPLLNEAVKEQIASVMAKLTQDVWLRAVVDCADRKCMELAAFLKAFARISPRLHLELYEPGEAPALEEEMECGDLYPVTGLYLEGTKFSGISFRGIPGGQEINSFVIAFYNAAGPGQPLEEAVKDRIRAIQGKRSVQIFVSLACHYCAETVILAQHIAACSPQIKAQMTDAGLYPALVEKYGLERVPVILLNGEHRLTGGKSMEELLSFIEQDGIKNK
ncbi:MAG: thioredoxin family protein [Lachnospiraceae bacterium]|nr:thioredoxin family protein [Lachnospiraceae bacterium]